MESEPHNYENSICVVDDQTDQQAANSGPDRELPEDQGDELVEVNLAGENEEPRLVFLSASLISELKDRILALLREFWDVFAWIYGEMPGLDSRVVTHKHNIKEGTTPLKQLPRHFRPELEIKIKHEIQKLLDVGFIKPIQHPTWLTNIVPVKKKKNGQIRCCIDFRDLNKACPKGEFSLPNIDMLVDPTAGHSMFFFMDRSRGYN